MNTRRQLSLAALVLANLVPLAGCFWWEWDAGLIVLFFWIENLVIGAFNLIKMAAAPVDSSLHHAGKLFMLPFFLIHYGGFCAVHGLFLMVFINGGQGPSALNNLDVSFAWGPFVFVALLIEVVQQAWALLPAGAAWGIASLIFSHGVSFVTHYLLGGERERLRLKDLMSLPYKRIVLLHIVIIAAGVPVMAMGSPLPLLALLVLAKLVMDAVMHLREHREPEVAVTDPR